MQEEFSTELSKILANSKLNVYCEAKMTIKYYTREKIDNETQEQIETMLDKFGLIMWETNYDEMPNNKPTILKE